MYSHVYTVKIDSIASTNTCSLELHHKILDKLRMMVTKIKFVLSTDIDNLRVDNLLVGPSPIVSGFPQQWYHPYHLQEHINLHASVTILHYMLSFMSSLGLTSHRWFGSVNLYIYPWY